MPNSLWIVLLDTSGSMRQPFTRQEPPTGLSEAGGWATKIEGAKELLIRRIGALRTPDVAVIEFKEKARLLFLEPASSFRRLEDRIRSLEAGGGTDLAAALDEAGRIPSLSSYSQIRLLVISDGLTDADKAGFAADQLRASNPQLAIGVLLIDQTDEGDKTAYRVATNDDVTYAYSYAQASRGIGDNAVQLLAQEQRALLNDILIAQDRPRLQTLVFQGSDVAHLTATMLVSQVVPVLQSLETLQAIADSAQGIPSQVQVLTISQTSPVTASVSGIAKAIEVLDERLTPWKRKHAKTMAELEEGKLRLELARLHAEAMGLQLRDDNVRANTRKTNAEASRLEIENQEKLLRQREAELRQGLLLLATEAVRLLCENMDLDPASRLQYETQAIKAISAYVDTKFEVRLLDDGMIHEQHRGRF